MATISRVDLRNIYEDACEDWKLRLEEEYPWLNIDELQSEVVPKKLILEGYDDADSNLKTRLEELFPEILGKGRNKWYIHRDPKRGVYLFYYPKSGDLIKGWFKGEYSRGTWAVADLVKMSDEATDAEVGKFFREELKKRCIAGSRVLLDGVRDISSLIIDNDPKIDISGDRIKAYSSNAACFYTVWTFDKEFVKPVLSKSEAENKLGVKII